MTAGPVASAGVLIGERFRLARKQVGARAPRLLSELDGDKLPALSSAPVRTRAQGGAPARHDILRVNEFLKRGDVRVVSRLFDFDGSGFVVRTYRFKRSELPAVLEVGDHLRYARNRWQVVSMTPAMIDRHRRSLRERRQLREPTARSSPADIERFVGDWLTLHARS